MNGQPYARLNNFYGQKRQLLGNQADHAAPAWRTNVSAQVSVGKGKQVMEQGSKIFLSRLPLDVGETEVEELFRKTVGPLKESFLIYNSQGRSKGMAVVSFQRLGDAAVARTKYDGKIVDGRRPLKIEIITDGAPVLMGPPLVPSLLNRLGVKGKTNQPMANGVLPPTQPRNQNARPPAHTQPALATRSANIPVPPRRVRQKKGPKRIKKLQSTAVTKDQLDKEMEDYRAAADMTGLL